MSAVARLDAWLRTTFTERNTRLEAAYRAAGVEWLDDPALDADKQALLHEGSALAGAIDAVPAADDERYELLGMVGFVLGACRRHEAEDPEVQAPVWAAAERLAAGLGVAPRYVFAHQAFWNTAQDGRSRTFTTLPDEVRFVELNALGVLGYRRAAAALDAVPALGVSHPLAGELLDEARGALEAVLAANRRLAHEVPVDVFFRSIRPYFKPHRVGARTLRGVNAGDFSSINEIDVLLGLCDPADPFYARLVAEKAPYVPPADRRLLAGLAARRPLLERFVAETEDGAGPGLRANARRFLAVCRAHGAAYAFHHHALVKPFLVRPAAATPPDRRAALSASGPPLEEVVAGLQRLRELRTAKAPLAVLRARVAPEQEPAVLR